MNKFWKKGWITWIMFIVIIVSYFFVKAPQPESDQKEEISKLIKDIKGIITEKGGYNLLSVSYHDSNGNQEIQGILIFLKDIKSTDWEYYYYNSAKWKKNAKFEPSPPTLITLSDFDLMKLLPILEQSKNKIITEKKINDVTIKSCEISINKPDIECVISINHKKKIENKLEGAEIKIVICPKYGGTDFKFTYDINGNLTEFTYDKPIVVNSKPN
jgi:hypothetical protein